MSEDRDVAYRGYRLICGARLTDGGRYLPTLAVARVEWPSRPRLIEVPSDVYGTEDEATESAKTLGVAWIEDYGVKAARTPR